MHMPEEAPALTPQARRLLELCLRLIALYLIALVAAVRILPPDHAVVRYAEELLQNAYIAGTIAVGGSLLLDLDIRFSASSK